MNVQVNFVVVLAGIGLAKWKTACSFFGTISIFVGVCVDSVFWDVWTRVAEWMVRSFALHVI